MLGRSLSSHCGYSFATRSARKARADQASETPGRSVLHLHLQWAAGFDNPPHGFLYLFCSDSPWGLTGRAHNELILIKSWNRKSDFSYIKAAIHTENMHLHNIQVKPELLVKQRSRRNLFEVERGGRPAFPRVARCSQPWALLQNPFGIPAACQH